MHSTNHFYGHAKIFARYCGMDEAPRIRGTIQHGWNLVHGFGFPHNVAHGHPKFVWSEVVRRRAWSIGWRNYYVLGAPWVYLLTMEPDLGREPGTERKGTIWYPFHGSARNEVTGDHTRLISEIKDTESGDVTVCLHYIEYSDARVRGIYEDAGFRVVCHGTYGGASGVDDHFLYRQLAELRRHRRVASNRLSSALFYGIAAGCEAAVYGDPMHLTGAGSQAALDGASPLYGDSERGHRMRPQLVGPQIDRAVAREIAEEELGYHHIAAPEEIRELFCWGNSGAMSS
ncbi:hypothetical protein ACIBH1_01700 [Nonomuraea sp. NPDC050663]|uniref:hypothetical protein n=1 Tax=Nonomuraea sp. NPDC050663 TaxID=3364370 RepID=UPI00378BAD98